MSPIRQKPTNIPQVDREAILDKEFEELEPHERRWLQDTAHWPEGAEKEPVNFHLPDGSEVSNDPAFLLAQAADSPALRRMIEERAQEIVRQMAGSAQHEQIVAASGEYPGHTGPPRQTVDEAARRAAEEDDEDDEVPIEQMGVMELRNEALRRDLSIAGEDGKKANLLKNIQAWDAEHPEGVRAYEASKDEDEDEE